MSQKQQRSAQRRAEKRHRREVERRHAQTDARKRSVATKEHLEFDEHDPVPSADEETVVHPYLTQRTRERDHRTARGLQRWRREMPGFSTHAEVEARSDDALFAALAERGLLVTRDDVLAQIARMPPGGSAWRMSRIYWLPAVGHPLRAADRDLLGLAAIELWRRLRPEDPPVETLLALLADAHDLRAHDEPNEYLAGLVRFLAAARPRIDPSTPGEIGGVKLALAEYRIDTVHLATRFAEQVPELAAAALDELDRWLQLGFDTESEADRRYLRDAGAIVCDALGRHAEAEIRLRASMAIDPGDIVARRLLAIQIHDHHDGERARLVEALDLWDSTAVAPGDDDAKVIYHETREVLAESLREFDAEAEAAR